MDKLKMHSPNFTDENIAKLAALFPNCVTESVDEDSNPKKSIDFDLLKQELSTHIVEGPQERYHLNWPDKRKALLTANAPIAKTLRPCREESVDFDTTANLFIEGDNLDALKLLQETYLGKVKMNYIDPPYNTGKDFIYADNFAESIEEYLLDSDQKDEKGNRLVSNSDWLSMLYPHLKLARNLLKNEGVIFISIGDRELHNLRKLCDEIFGANNFITTFSRMMKSGGAKGRFFTPSIDFILVYTKNILATPLFRSKFSKAQIDRFYTKIEESALVDENGKKSIWNLYNKLWLKEQEDKGVVPSNFIGNFENRQSSAELKSMGILFDFAKPTKLLEYLIEISRTKTNDIIVDFFAGSASTAHAVIQANVSDNNNRKYIMIQLPETCDEKSEAFKAGYQTIAEISKERIRRAGKKIKEENAITALDLDIGFRVLKVEQIFKLMSLHTEVKAI